MKNLTRTPITHSSELPLFQTLASRHRTPKNIQELIFTYEYNSEATGETCKSALSTAVTKVSHCLEASLVACALFEVLGIPPLVMSLESIDNLDHVVAPFQTPQGWGAVGRSRELGLQGRAPVFRSLRDLAWSYVDPYVDETARVKGFAVVDLRDIKAPWRDSQRNVWSVENFLIDLPHQKLLASDNRHEKVLQEYLENGEHPRKRHWWTVE